MTANSSKSLFGAFGDDLPALQDIFKTLYNLARSQMPYDMLSLADQDALAYMFLERHSANLYPRVILCQEYTLQTNFVDFDPESLPPSYSDKQLAIIHVKKYGVCMKRIVGNSAFLLPTYNRNMFYMQASYFLQCVNEWINDTDPDSGFYDNSRYTTKHIARLKAEYGIDVYDLAAQLAHHSVLSVINNFIALNIKLRRDMVRLCSIPRFLDGRTERKFETDLNAAIDEYQRVYSTTIIGNMTKTLGPDGWFKRITVTPVSIVLALSAGYACYRYYIKRG